MAEFDVIPAKLKEPAGKFESCAGQMGRYANQVLQISASLNQMGAGTENVKRALRTVSEQMTGEQKSLMALKEKLTAVIMLYEDTEKSICGQAKMQQTGRVTQPENGTNGNPGNELNGNPGNGTNGNPGNEPNGNPGNGTNNNDGQDGGFWDYIWDALKQAAGGDFVDENNFLGVVLSVGISFIPVAGQAADIRDLIADIHNLIDDGPATEEWVALGFTALGFVPGLKEVLKHGDDAADTVKTLLKNSDKADDAADIVKQLFRKGDDAVSAVGSKIDKFNDAFKRRITDRFEELFSGSSVRSGITDTFHNIKDAVAGSAVYKELDQFLDKIQYQKDDFEISLKGMAEGVFEEYVENFEQWGITSLLDFITGKQQPQPAPAQ